MGFHKSPNGIPIYLEICPKNITYIELKEDIECFFEASLYGFEYQFKAAWPKNDPMEILEGLNYIVSGRLIKTINDELIIFINEIGILNVHPARINYPFNRNDFENYYPPKEENKDIILPHVIKGEDLPPQEPSTSAASVAESEPNCETKVNEVQYQEPQQCDADELTY